MKERILSLFILFICFIPAVSGSMDDSTQISLLTVFPRSNAVYTKFGHTAIRVYNPVKKWDTVFNYGMFDFDSPNFMYRFVKGETDYSLANYEYRFFEYAYKEGGSTVFEQVLNIPAKEKEQLIEALRINLQPENAEYRYNYFFDNCTTRPRDLIEKFCGGRLVYTEPQTKTTFRTLVHECMKSDPWTTFGIDLIIGNGADSLISFRNEMFLPLRLMNGLETAYVLNDSLQKIPLVSSSGIIIKSEPDTSNDKSWSHPLRFGIILLIHSIVFAVCGFIWKKRFRIFFGLLFLQAGLAGCVVWFVAFVSSHSCTWPNMNVLWLHPLYLIAFVGFFFRKTYPVIRWFHWSNFVILSVFLILWKVIPQEINIACLPFILCFWLGSGLQIFLKEKHNYETNTHDRHPKN